MTLYKVLEMINLGIGAIFMVCYAYQFFYIFWALVKKPIKHDNKEMHRFAVMIAARNEENVIGNLLDSLNAQTYPSELYDIYVIADNCTDETAKAAAEHGAAVFERHNTEFVGKGYAMQHLFGKVMALKGNEYYDGYFIFDADNLLDKHFIEEMNKAFYGDNRIITCYRNSKNYGDNWVSSGYALWFLREAKFLNNPRYTLGTSCAVSGTGFLIHRDIINRNGGWKHFLLTEDIEFTIDSILHGEKIGYCHDAVLYDEQPTKFSQSWSQRMRWAKGYLQVFMNYGGKMLKGIFKKRGFACFDMTMNIMPAVVFTVLGLIINAAMLIISIVTGNFTINLLLTALLQLLSSAYVLMFVIGLITALSEWKNIHCSTGRKILSIFTFPIFMISYVPIAIAAFFKKVEWKQIEHTVDLSINDIK